jgi:hypothetical protein
VTGGDAKGFSNHRKRFYTVYFEREVIEIESQFDKLKIV